MDNPSNSIIELVLTQMIRNKVVSYNFKRANSFLTKLSEIQKSCEL